METPLKRLKYKCLLKNDYYIFREKSIEVRFEDGDLWLTQKAIADLFDTSKQDVSYHLKNIFNTLELEENSVVKKYLTTANDNKKYNTNYYNLDAVISIGFLKDVGNMSYEIA